VSPELRINNAPDDIGSSVSLTAYGPDGAQASTAPFQRRKGHVWNGGADSPFIPAPGIEAGIAPGIAPTFAHLAYIPATVMDLAGEAVAGIPAERDAITLRPLFSDAGSSLRAHADAVGCEHSYERVIRMGDWKAVFGTINVSWVFPFEGPSVRWRLFELASDQGETVDPAQKDPARLASMAKAWEAYADCVGDFIPPQLRGAASGAH